MILMCSVVQKQKPNRFGEAAPGTCGFNVGAYAARSLGTPKLGGVRHLVDSKR